MRYPIIIAILTLTSCFKKKEVEASYSMPEVDLLELDDEDLEHLPEAGDTGD